MPNIHIDNVGDMAVVECEGRFIRSEDAFKLRNAVTSQCDAQVVVLDLTEMRAIGGGAVGMLVYLQRWAHDVLGLNELVATGQLGGRGHAE